MFLKISSFAFWKKIIQVWNEMSMKNVRSFILNVNYTFIPFLHCVTVFFQYNWYTVPDGGMTLLALVKLLSHQLMAQREHLQRKSILRGDRRVILKHVCWKWIGHMSIRPFGPSKNSHDRKTRILQKERSAIKHKTCPQQNKLKDFFSSRLKNTTRNALLLFSTPRAWHLTSPEHSSEDRKCFLCIFSPGTGRGETWTPFSYVEPVNSLWTSGTAKRSFSPHPNGFTLRRPTTNMTSSLDCKTSKLWV